MMARSLYMADSLLNGCTMLFLNMPFHLMFRGNVVIPELSRSSILGHALRKGTFLRESIVHPLSKSLPCKGILPSCVSAMRLICCFKDLLTSNAVTFAVTSMICAGVATGALTAFSNCLRRASHSLMQHTR